MSSNEKRTFYDLTNENKRSKTDSIVDFSFSMEQLGEKKSQNSLSTSTSSESFMDDDNDDDDDVFQNEEQTQMRSAVQMNQNKGRKRLNGTSTYRIKEKKNRRTFKMVKRQNDVNVDDVLNQLRKEQARIDAHSFSIMTK